MEPDVIRLYSSSPPPMDEAGEEEEEDEFGEFGSFSGGGVSSSFSVSEIDTPTTFNQSNALEDLPPDLYITSVQDVTVSGKSAWVKERKLVWESQQPCVGSNQDASRNETEVDSCVENTEEPSEIVINGVVSSDLQRELLFEHSKSVSNQHCPLALPDVRYSSTGQHIESTGNGHSLSNGYSESCTRSQQKTESSVSSGLDVTNVESNKEQTPTVSMSHSCHKEASDLEERKATAELCGDFQSFSSFKITQEAQGEENQRENKGTEETGVPDASGCSSDENVVYSDTHFLSGSTDCVDTYKTATATITGTDLISETQLSGDTREIHESLVKAELEEDVDSEALNETPDEDFGDFRDAQGFMDISQTESVTQEGFADFVTAMSRCSTDDEFGDTDTLKDFQEEDELAVEEERSAGCAGDEAFCSELPPSDSFADFSSAPFGGVALEEENWASFGQHKAAEEGQDSWATFGDEQSAFQCKETQDVVTSAALCSDNLQSSRSDRETAEFSCKVQHLFKTAFPSDVSPEVSEVTEVLSLQDLLQAQNSWDQGDSSSSFPQRHELAIWHHLQDIHGAHGLKFKWAGSHSNRIMLDCLGIRNILFTGEKKQPMIVPMFAAGLGMLEPTKESQKSPASPALFPSVPVESGNILCTQVAPSLTINVDDGGISELNLDYFGPVDECSSDSENEAPLPGVDPVLYELTTAKLENKTAGQSIADAFTKLMESVEKNRTTTRKAEQDEKISEEAAKVISRLPDLSFMQARVLMFPSVLTPAANHT